MGPYLTQHKKINAKWIKHLTKRPEAIKLLEENIGENSHGIDLSKDIFHMTPQVEAIKAKIDKSKKKNKLLH